LDSPDCDVCCTRGGGLLCQSSPDSCGPGRADERLCDEEGGCPAGEKCCKESNSEGFCCVDEGTDCPESLPLSKKEGVCHRERKRDRKKENREKQRARHHLRTRIGPLNRG